MKHIRNITALTAAIIGLFTLTFGLGGCSSQTASAAGTEKKPAVCFVIANTANSQGINFNSPLIQDTVKDCAENYGSVSVISADGSSQFLGTEDMNIDEKYKHASKEKLASDAAAKANSLVAYMQTVVADDSELDLYDALSLASRTMASLEGYSSKTIIVLSTGLSTAGNYVNFHNNLISADPAAVADLLEEKEAIPDFSGMTVYWQGLGDVAAPQEDLTPAQRNRLEAIWNEIIVRGGGNAVFQEYTSVPVNSEMDYPEMSVVELPAETPVVFNTAQFKSQAFQEPFILTEEMVAFRGDSAEYLQPETAMETIRPIAECLLQQESIHLLLAGTTAGDATNAATKELSAQRAEAVRQTLIEYGVAANRIQTVGLGSSDPWHIPNAGVEGSLAAANRKVVVMDLASKQAQEILRQQP